MHDGVHQMKIEPIVNYTLMDRVLEIKQRAGDSTFALETIGITDLWNKAIAMTDDELIVCTLAALYKCPDMVFAAMAQDREELLKAKESKND